MPEPSWWFASPRTYACCRGWPTVFPLLRAPGGSGLWWMGWWGSALGRASSSQQCFPRNGWCSCRSRRSSSYGAGTGMLTNSICHKFHSNVSMSLDATNSRQHQIEIEWVYLLSSTFLSVAVRSFCLAVSQNLTLSHSDLKAKNLMAFSRAVFRLEARRDIVWKKTHRGWDCDLGFF